MIRRIATLGPEVRKLAGGLLIVLGGLVVWMAYQGFPVTHSIAPSDITRPEGLGDKSWVVQVVLSEHILQIPADTVQNPLQSDLRLFENDRALGPPHSEHLVIGKLGQGRYSYWDGFLYFSTSDGTDPRVNGRDYNYSTNMVLPSWLGLLGIAMVGLGGGLFFYNAICAFLGLLTRKDVAFNLGSITLIVIVIAGAGEAYFRLIAGATFTRPNWPSEFDPQVGFRFKPNEEVRHTNGMNFWTITRTNSLGFLDREPDPKAIAASGCHIAVIGDSYVEAAQVPIEDKLQVHIEQKLEAQDPSRDITTAAFGFSGTGQLNQLPFYDVYARPQEPDLLVLVFVGNDFANNSRVLEAVRNGWDPDALPRVFARRDETGAFTTTPIAADWRELHTPGAPSKSFGPPPPTDYHFLNWIRNKLWTLTAGRRATKDLVQARAEALSERPVYARYFEDWTPETLGEIDVRFNREEALPRVFLEGLASTAFALKEFRDRAQQDGLPLVILGAHSLYDLEAETPSLGMERLRALARETGIPLIDQAAYILDQGHRLNEAKAYPPVSGTPLPWGTYGRWIHRRPRQPDPGG